MYSYNKYANHEIKVVQLKINKVFNGRVILDHLIKTAGQSVSAELLALLGSGCVLSNIVGEHKKLISRYGGDYSVITGHMFFKGEGLDPRYHYITCLREPLDRVISHLYFVVNNHNEMQHGDYWSAVRVLESEGNDIDDGFIKYIKNPYTTHFLSINNKTHPTDNAKLTAALAAIDQYDVWGLYEDLPGFMTDVSALLGLGTPAVLPRVNVTKMRPAVADVSPKLLRRLTELNELDLEFYQVLKQRWQQRQKQPVVSLPSVSRWTPYNKQLDRVFTAPEFTLLSATLIGTPNVERHQVITFALEFSLTMPAAELEMGIHVFDVNDELAVGTNTTLLNKKVINVKLGTHSLQYHLVVDLPEGAYNAGFSFIANDAQGSHELAWFDKLLDFSVTILRPQACLGYVSMPVVVTCSQTSAEVPSLVTDAAGKMSVNGVLGIVMPDEVFVLSVLLENASTQTWGNLYTNPLNLSYHWQDFVGNDVIFEGTRSPLPVSLVPPGSHLPMSLSVQAPALPGEYQLVLLPIQENHCWFDQFGFTPAVLKVVVSSAVTTWRYLGNDCRLFTQCGRPDGTALLANGQEGFLIYGPYLAVPVGHYVARLRLNVNAALFGAWVDIVDVADKQSFARIDIAPMLAQSTEVAVEFELKTNCSNLEVRLWVPTGSDLAVQSLLIELVDAYVGSSKPSRSHSIN